ncbi:MAG: hypothetical protein LBV33_08540 [Lachnospiraceae bacterium]|jgi:cytochrome oxidase Cu insertion factor (SCO1/SenC/PrrC family)|nr:hypothetical protein [Lachnospiraceae bacterium]
MITLEQLDQLSQIEMGQADRTKLVDIKAITIDPSQPAIQRMESYLENVKNPYLFLCGDTTVRICFEPDGQELINKLKTHFEHLKTG